MEPRRNIDVINDAMKKGQKLYPDLCFVKRTSDKGELLEVTQLFALHILQDAPMFSDALCRSSLKSINYYFETLNSWFWNLDQSSPLLSTGIASLSYAWFLVCAFKLSPL